MLVPKVSIGYDKGSLIEDFEVFSPETLRDTIVALFINPP